MFKINTLTLLIVLIIFGSYPIYANTFPDTTQTTKKRLSIKVLAAVKLNSVRLSPYKGYESKVFYDSIGIVSRPPDSLTVSNYSSPFLLGLDFGLALSYPISPKFTLVSLPSLSIFDRKTSFTLLAKNAPEASTSTYRSTFDNNISETIINLHLPVHIKYYFKSNQQKNIYLSAGLRYTWIDIAKKRTKTDYFRSSVILIFLKNDCLSFDLSLGMENKGKIANSEFLLIASWSPSNILAPSEIDFINETLKSANLFSLGFCFMF